MAMCQPHTPDTPVASLPSSLSLPLLELLHQSNDFGIGDKQSLGSLHGLACVLAGLQQLGSTLTYLVLTLYLLLQ